MEIPRKRRVKRVEQPTVENKNRMYSCSMCSRMFSLIVPPAVGVGTIADRALFDMIKIEFTTHNHDYHNDKAKLIDPHSEVKKLNA